MEGKPHTEIHTCSVWVHTGKAFGQLQSHCGLTLQERVSMLLYNTGTECSSTSECQLSRLTHVINFTEYLLTLTKKKKSSVENRKLTDLTWMDIELWANELSGLCWMLIKGWSFREALGHAYTWCIKFHRCVPLLEIVLLWRMIRTKEMAQKIKGFATKSDGLS